jgi:hypothetical protein
MKTVNSYPVLVIHPSGKARRFSSVRAVARMLSGNGTASGGLREQIESKGVQALVSGFTDNIVRNNAIVA